MQNRALVLVLCFLALAAPAVLARKARPHSAGASGVRGTAVEGPITPVERPGQPNTRPLPGATITVQKIHRSNEIARGRADENGHFEIPLAPGKYQVVLLPPHSGGPFSREVRVTVNVPSGRWIEVTLDRDTGIR